MRPTPRARSIALLAVAALLLAACTSTGTGTPSTRATVAQRAAADTLGLCTATVTGTSVDYSTWREVTGPGFRFCVPPTWLTSRPRDTTAAAAGRWRHGTDRSIEWRVGPFKPTGPQMTPFNEMEERDVWLGTRASQLHITSIEDRNWFDTRFAATAELPEVRFFGSATGAAARAEVDAVFRTLRAPATP